MFGAAVVTGEISQTDTNTERPPPSNNQHYNPLRVRSSFSSMQNMLTIISNALCRITGRNAVSVGGVSVGLAAASEPMLTVS